MATHLQHLQMAVAGSRVHSALSRGFAPRSVAPLRSQAKGGSFSGDEPDAARKQTLQSAMRKKRLLLVLDDCWENVHEAVSSTTPRLATQGVVFVLTRCRIYAAAELRR